MKKFVYAALLTLGLPSAADANTLIDFDATTAMGNSPGAAVPVASQVSTQFLGSGVLFSSGAGYAAVVDHVPGCPTCTPTPPNIIGGTAAGGTLDYSAPITATFFSPTNPLLKATTNFVQVLGDRVPLGSGTITFNGYDLAGALIASTTAPDVGAPGTGATLTLTAAGIHSVSFFSDNRTVGFDNFEFGELTVAPVPEPATWGMMILGFGVVGGAMRRRRVMTAVA